MINMKNVQNDELFEKKFSVEISTPSEYSTGYMELVKIADFTCKFQNV